MHAHEMHAYEVCAHEMTPVRYTPVKYTPMRHPPTIASVALWPKTVVDLSRSKFQNTSLCASGLWSLLPAATTPNHIRFTPKFV